MKLLNGDKASVTTTTVTNTVVDEMTSGTVTLNLITDYTVTDANTIKNAFESSAITVAAGGEWITALDGNTSGGTIVITVTANGLDVTLSATGASTIVASISATDTVVADANGNYVYDDHGISFTIAAADYANLTAGNILQVSGVTTAQGSTISLANDWDSNTGAVTLATISTTNTGDNDNLWDIQVVVTTSLATFTLRDSAGGTIHEDAFVPPGTGLLTYDAHGVSFDYEIGGAASGVFSLTANRTTTTTSVTASSTVYSAGLSFQVGSNESQEMLLNIQDMRAGALSIAATATGTGFISTAGVSDGESSSLTQFAIDVSSSAAAASDAITVFDNAINTVSQERAKLGAVQNRLEYTINNLDTSAENLQASESRIRDVDMAKEMMEFTKNNILMQAAQAMLAQANQQPQGVLQLLR
jgi:flagellin